MRPSYLYNGNSYTGKTASFYWDIKTVFPVIGVLIMKKKDGHEAVLSL